MKLSDAILLGDSMKMPASQCFLTCDGHGCALGGAVIAAGRAREYNYKPLQLIQAIWPWFPEIEFGVISGMYDMVCEGKQNIEQIADYVRSIEPPEAEPEPQAEEEYSDVNPAIEVYRGR